MANLGDLENVEYPFAAIAPRSTLTWSGRTWLGPTYGSKSTNYVCKQMTDIKLWLLYSNTWNYLTVWKNRSVSFKNDINKMCLKIIYTLYMVDMP